MSLEQSIKDAFKGVNYPGYSRDIMSFGLVKNLAVSNGSASIELELTSHNPEVAAQLKASVEAAATSVDGIDRAMVQIKMPPAGQAPAAAGAQPNRMPGINKVFAVASGKGGVGKSTCAVNLACALAQEGGEIGLLDCDIYGPSVPLMMGVNERPMVSPEDKLVPLMNHGVKLMSMGFLLDGDQPVIWRGPMIMKTIQQFVMQVDWGTLDFLLVDLPPGTGDAQLSLCQTVPLDGGLIVTTPQEASLGVVRKGIAMFEKVNVPILGIVENMSYFTAPGGERVEIFGHGGGASEAEGPDRREGGGAGGEVTSSSGDSRGSRGLPEELLKEIEVMYGFDKPAHERFLKMLGDYATFDFGESFFRDRSVIELILDKMPVSISLGLWSTLIIYLVSIPLGIRKAVTDGSRFDVWTSSAIVVGYAIPGFLFAIGLAAGMRLKTGARLVPDRTWARRTALVLLLLTVTWMKIGVVQDAGRAGLAFLRDSGFPFYITNFDKTFLAAPRLLHFLGLVPMFIRSPISYLRLH